MPTTSRSGTRSPNPVNAARILICDELAPVAVEIFRERGFEPEVRTGMSEDELVETVGDVHALVVRSATKITRRVIEAAGENLAVIGRAGIGVDNVDTDAATERGIVVMNTPTGNTTTTAEHAISLLCSLARHIPRADRSVRGGAWKKKGLMGTELTGKTLGVVGLGRIGRIVAERAQGLKMNVVAFDPYIQAGQGTVPGVDLIPLEDLLARADFVTLHVPLTDSTKNLISRERIAAMKPGARLINAARGGLVDEAALLEGLEEGKIAGAALDVLADEPPIAGHPLLDRDDVIVTPHLGASSHEAQENVARDIANQISDFLAEGIAHNALNAPAVSSQVLHEIAPYLLLAEKMGSILAQRLRQPVRKIELTISGEIAQGDTEYVRLSLLIGILRHGMETGVNFVNAPRAAKERGVKLLECAEDEPHHFTSLIKARVFSRGGAETALVVGTVFGRNPRLVRIDDVHLDLDPSGPILITRHRDVPGVVGLLGTVLGRHGINIKRIELGPPMGDTGADEPARLAAGFLSLYDEPADEVLRDLAELDPVDSVELIHA